MRAGNWTAAREGGARKGMTEPVSANNSFCVAERTGAGATGAEGAFGFTQHVGVEQLLELQCARQQFDFPSRVLALALIVKTLCHTRTNPRRRPTAVFTIRDVMPFNGSVCTGIFFMHSARLIGLRKSFLFRTSRAGFGARLDTGREFDS